MKNKTINIAIDGPAGVGKSTIARRLADTLNFIYIDTGAMFRTMAVFCLDKGIDVNDESKVAAAVPEARINVGYTDGEQHMFLDCMDVNDRIRTEEVSQTASIISQYKAVRDRLLELQRELAAKNNVIMDGRDIGTVVLPNADLKIFLIADSRERARRRYLQLEEQGKLNGATLDDIYDEQQERDFRDFHRAIAPLVPADDAVMIDTTEMKIEEVVERIRTELDRL